MDGGGDLSKRGRDLEKTTLLTGKRSLIAGVCGRGNVSAPGTVDTGKLTRCISGDYRPDKWLGEVWIKGMQGACVHFVSNLTNRQTGACARLPHKESYSQYKGLNCATDSARSM